MDPITQQTVLAAAGAAGGDPVYVDDVFSTYLYDGTNSNHSINNGIDLAGEGGLVWIKGRGQTGWQHILVDTERGATKHLSTNNNSAQLTASNTVPTFSSTGFATGTDNQINYSSETAGYASWTFRKAPGFFDVVTYSGDSDPNRTISHNLGSTPGMIIVKGLQANRDWVVHHRSVGFTKYMVLNSGGESYNISGRISAADASTFTPGSDSDTNQTGKTYVAYIFAHDDAQFGTDGDESIIKCGSYTGGGNTSVEVNLGFEPQWVLIKSKDTGYNWWILDNMRGISPGDDRALAPNSSANETAFGALDLTATGFKTGTNSNANKQGDTFIYMAIRRPNKPQEVATDVFAVTSGNNNNNPTFTSGFPVDLAFWKIYVSGSTDDFKLSTRLLGSTYQVTSASGTEQAYSPIKWDRMDGWEAVSNGTSYISYMFKRTPGFVDVVAYNGTGSVRTVSHNLDAVPELMIVKVRNASDQWCVWQTDVFASNNTYKLRLDTNDAAAGSGSIFNSTAPTDSVFTLGTSSRSNYSGSPYTAYLFATLPGISKVGSYTGNGGSSAFDVDCGFTNGARFVLIKDVDSSNDWYVWDTVRGMTSSAAPYLRLNQSVQQSTSNWVETQTSGFKVTTGTNANLRINISGNTYIFLAIA